MSPGASFDLAPKPGTARKQTASLSESFSAAESLRTVDLPNQREHRS
ncbi:MAG: hypothetical protein ACI8RN_002486 [Glaciecola sp.]|jgi:hypothetical protein